ncbi:MAG: TolC family protein, partial [Opitutaceae bacterium]|nr:TolC family protein [Opitutaceae bacterium]
NASLSANYSKHANDLSSPGASSNNDWGAALSVTQVLYAGGGLDAALDAQRLVRDAALLDLRGAVNTALTDVRVRFYNVLLTRDRVAVQEQNIALYEEQLQTVRSRRKAGAVSDFEVLRAEVALANARPALITARNDARIALDVLLQSLGCENTGTPPQIIGALGYHPVKIALADALAAARAKRPDLLRLEKIASARDIAISAENAAARPQVGLFGGYQYRKNLASDSFRPAYASNGWLAGIQASWAIFDGRRIAGRVAQAKSQLAQAQLSLREAALAVDVEVRTALSALQEAAELADAAQKVVAQAEEALRLADARYAAGSATQLDVLQSRVELTRARDNAVQANYSHNAALANLRRAMGEGETW